jgi:N-acetylglucosaminyldiphosphoundecaprenol N-acetyl-beta-D-mannosaminyltransferase
LDSKTGTGVERVELLGIPIDILPADCLKDRVRELLRGKTGGDGGHNIILLSFTDLIKARRPGEFRDFILGADIVIPISRSLVNGVRFLDGRTPIRYMPFDFIISLLTILEESEETVYLLGGKTTILRKTYTKIRQTFPRLRVVGRFPGSIKRGFEETVLLSIRKCAPSLLLIGQGMRGGEKWVARNNDRLSPALRLWCSDIFEVFSERKKRPSRFAFDHGLEWIGYTFTKPF